MAGGGVALAAAGAAGLVQLAGNVVLEGHALELEGVERQVVEGLDAVLHAADALVQRLVLLGELCEVLVLQTQRVQLLAVGLEVMAQRMVLYVHG